MKEEIVKQKLRKIHSLLEKADSILDEFDKDTLDTIRNCNFYFKDMPLKVNQAKLVTKKLLEDNKIFKDETD